MKRSYKILTILLLSCFLFVSGAAPILQVKAAVVFKTSLCEPIPTDNAKYFIIGNPDNQSFTLYAFYCPLLFSGATFDVIWQINSSGNYEYYASISSADGAYTSNYYMLNYSSAGTFSYQSVRNWGQIYATSLNISSRNYYANYGCSFIFDTSLQQSGARPTLMSIDWAYDSTIEDYFDYLINISLKDIQDSLDDFHYDFTQFEKWFEKTFSDFVDGNYNQLALIYMMLLNIYKTLGGGEEEPTFESENTSELDDYYNAEDAIMQDYGGELQGALQYGNNVFSSNSGFSFISATMQDLILNNTKLNMIIIFTLGLGLAVLVIGRKINS